MRTFLLLFILIVACEANTANPPPAILFSEEEMEDILYDITLLKTIKNNRFGAETPKDILNNNYILRKYNIADSTLKQNQHYYAQSPKKMLLIYERIFKRLEKAEDSIAKLVQREQEELEARLQRKKDSITAQKKRDSLALIVQKDSLDFLKLQDSLSLLKQKDSLKNLNKETPEKLGSTKEN